MDTMRRGRKHYERKEVNAMNYEKPEIIVLASALGAVQSLKPGQSKDSACNNPENGYTNCGYQSDE
jgi:hypothetical protein